MTYSFWGRLVTRWKHSYSAGAKLDAPGALETVGLPSHSSLPTEKSKVPLWRQKLSVPQITKA